MGNKSIFSTVSSSFSFNGTKYYLTDLSYNESFDKIEVTDTSTTGDGKEYKTGRAERTFTADLMYDTGSADITLNSIKGIEVWFEGKKYIGSGSLYNKSVKGTIDDAVKVTYEGSFNGAVTASLT